MLYQPVLFFNLPMIFLFHFSTHQKPFSQTMAKRTRAPAHISACLVGSALVAEALAVKAAILHDIFLPCQSSVSTSFSYMSRSSNVEADGLAKAACNLNLTSPFAFNLITWFDQKKHESLFHGWAWENVKGVSRLPLWRCAVEYVYLHSIIWLFIYKKKNISKRNNIYGLLLE